MRAAGREARRSYAWLILPDREEEEGALGECPVWITRDPEGEHGVFEIRLPAWRISDRT
jgi:hypothetical protein